MRRRVPLAILVALVLGRPAAGGELPGPFHVGVTNITFTKQSVTTQATRVLDTIVWYPAAAHSGTAEALGQRDASVHRGRFPLLVFSHGACGRPTEASYYTMALASAGFVVAAPPHVGNTADDPGCGAAFGDSAANRVPDVRYVMDSMLAQAGSPGTPFSRRLKPTAIGVTGLSFGGFTTFATEVQDSRVKAALAMVPGGSVVLGTGVAVPTMIIGSEKDQIVGFAESQAGYDRLAGPRFLVELLAAGHLSVTDACTPLCIPDGVSQDDAHALVLRYAVPFFRRYLAGRHGVRVPGPVSGVVLTAEPHRHP